MNILTLKVQYNAVFYCSIINLYKCLDLGIWDFFVFPRYCKKNLQSIKQQYTYTHKTDEQKTSYRKCNLHIQNQTHFKRTKNQCALQMFTGIYINIQIEYWNTYIKGNRQIHNWTLCTVLDFKWYTFAVYITFFSCFYFSIFLSPTLSKYISNNKNEIYFCCKQFPVVHPQILLQMPPS